jgi:hypothetical protein
MQSASGDRPFELRDLLGHLSVRSKRNEAAPDRVVAARGRQKQRAGSRG